MVDDLNKLHFSGQEVEQGMDLFPIFIRKGVSNVTEIYCQMIFCDPHEDDSATFTRHELPFGDSLKNLPSQRLVAFLFVFTIFLIRNHYLPIMSSPFLTLTTDRLLLRTTTQEDLPEVLYLRSDPEVNRYIFRSEKVGVKQAQEFLDRVSEGLANEQFYYWAITLLGTTKMIGSICLWNLSKDRTKAEIGYDLHPDYQGRGIMSEAMSAVLKFGFERLQLATIEAYTHKENDASMQVLKRNGFLHLPDRVDEGHEWNWVFALTKHQALDN